MKNKILVLALVALALAAALVLAGCGEGCPGRGDCSMTGIFVARTCENHCVNGGVSRCNCLWKIHFGAED